MTAGSGRDNYPHLEDLSGSVLVPGVPETMNACVQFQFKFSSTIFFSEL